MQQFPTRPPGERGEDFATAISHQSAGRNDKAKALYRRTLRKLPGHAGSLHMLGMMAREEGRAARAVQLLSKAAASDPSSPYILCDLGNALKVIGRYEEAEHFHLRVLEMMPDSAEALSNLGSTYRAWDRLDEAIDCFRRAADLCPDHPELLYNLANGLLAAGRYGEAEALFRTVGDLAGGHSGALIGLGVALKEQGRLAEAAETQRAALLHSPESAVAGYNLALTLLMAGDYAAGWHAYEYRRRIPDFAMRRPSGTAWDGAPLAGRTLLVHAEQGLGDTLQFMRYLKPAAAAGGTVIFHCPPALVPLLSGCPDMPRIVPFDQRPPAYDVHAPLMSLPHLLGGAPPHIPAGGVYAAADPARAALWANWQAGTARRIGIAWQGRPDYRQDDRRSPPLAAFAPLSDVPDVTLVSLQKGPGTEQLPAAAAWRNPVRDPGPAFDGDGAFLDTAALIQGLDLVITSDTAIAHLAGALGIETWVVLAHIPDWRWGLAGESTPWYPSMRLFRQERAGDWTGVFKRVAAALAARQ